MNLNNYASLEASKRLYYSDIVLDTEMCWEVGAKATRLTRWEVRSLSKSFRYAAPSMAEVWRELPEEIMEYNSLFCVKSWGKTLCYYHGKMQFSCFNPTDALIDLLIWVKEASHEG